MFTHKISAFWKNNRGISVVELGLLAVPLSLLIAGIVDVGIGLTHQLKLERTAKAASELALISRPVNNDTSHIRTAAYTIHGTDTITVPLPTITCECYVGDPEQGTAIACDTACASGERKSSYINVSVSEVYRPVLGYFISSSGMTLTGQSSLRLQ